MRVVVQRIPLFAFLLAAVALFSAPAFGAPRDKAALKKIEEAIYTHFLNTEFDKAEGVLLGTIQACEDKCSPEVKAKAWMYVGLVRGSGRNDMQGAGQAFGEAFKLDANVKLDEQIATPEVKAAFAQASGAGAPAAAGEGGADPGEEGMGCTLEVTQVETRRPIPIACGSQAELAGAKLFFKGFAQSWQSVPMQEVEGEWQGSIPCKATDQTGKLRWYVQGLDENGEAADSNGSEEEPNSIDIVNKTDEAPPAFPDQEPPQRCGAGGGGACGGWGEACGADDCCDAGLACILGTCEASQCESDKDCSEGACVDGKCRRGGRVTGPSKKNWLSAHFGLDLAVISSDGACTQQARDENFTCFDSDGNAYNGRPNLQAAGTIGSGLVLSTMRAMVAYERIFGPIGIELRAGYAFNGGPDFLPAHVELRGKFWVLGEKAFGAPGVRPWVHLGGGLAQVDATVPVEVVDCTNETDPTACETNDNPLASGGSVEQFDATKALGQSFITAGGGVMYAIGLEHGPVLNLNAMFLFPSSGFVLAPSLGYAVGF